MSFFRALLLIVSGTIAATGATMIFFMFVIVPIAFILWFIVECVMLI